jgi:hypothetical protein
MLLIFRAPSWLDERISVLLRKQKKAGKFGRIYYFDCRQWTLHTIRSFGTAKAPLAAVFWLVVRDVCYQHNSGSPRWTSGIV